jgi:hypothetical protein
MVAVWAATFSPYRMASPRWPCGTASAAGGANGASAAAARSAARSRAAKREAAATTARTRAAGYFIGEYAVGLRI